jgi:dimethylargininase
MPMRVFDFTHAIVREPGRSVVNGLRDDPAQTPSFEKIATEHRGYVAALRDLGLSVDVLPPLEAFPDSIFVEDPALVFPQGAILLRPGAPSRAGERGSMRVALARYFESVVELDENEQADGGDVLVTPETAFIGLSKRTTRTGAEALARHLRALGRNARIAETPAGILHFKTASSLLDETTILCTPAMAQSGVFEGFRLVITPPGEEAAANALRVNDTVLLGDRFPRTAELIRGLGLSVKTLAVTEIAKLDAGLSCMSLRW